jgi:phosphate acetyltransferase
MVPRHATVVDFTGVFDMTTPALAKTEDFIENHIFADIAVGQTASISRQISADDIALFAIVSGDINPAHLDPQYAATDLFHHIIAHGMWGGGLISAVLGTELPGPGTIYLSQDLHFHAPVSVGDTITATVTVSARNEEKHNVTLDCICTNQDGRRVITGTAVVKAPDIRLRLPRAKLPEVWLQRHERFRPLIEQARALPLLSVAVAHPCDPVTMAAIADLMALGMIAPILVGPQAKIAAAAAETGFDLGRCRVVDTPHSHAAAAEAVALVRNGEAALLMKGSLHTDELMHEVMCSTTGLRTDRRLSHVYVMDVPSYDRLLLVTDAAINIAPTLEEKADIVRNAIDVAHVLGIAMPKVAVLSAIETVNPALRSSVEAAALAKMADRGQITGAIVDGPLAFDNAVSLEAAAQKGIVSAVAGMADILVVPDLETGNMVAKQFSFLAGADAAGVVAGARVPIILTSRADSERTRVASCALARLMAEAGADKR